MPNGSSISQELFERIDLILGGLDIELETLAHRLGGELSRNYHGDPNRSVTYVSSDGVSRSLMITALVPDDANDVSLVRFQFSITAWRDESTGRRYHYEVVDRLDSLPDPSTAAELLKKMHLRADSIDESDLRNKA